MASVKEQTINSAKWVLIDKGANQGLSFLFSLLMARILMPEDFGVLAIITTVINITSIFVDSGFTSALIRKPLSNEKDLSTVFYFNILIAVLSYILLFVFAPYLAVFFKMPILKVVLRVQTIILITNAFAAVQIAILTIRLDFRSMALRSAIASVSSCTIAIVLAYSGLGIWALVSQAVLYSIINLILISIYCKWRPTERFNKDSFKELGGYGSKLLLSSLIHTIYQEMTSILIGRFYTAEDLGYYNRGSDFAKMPTMAINGVVMKVTFPILAKIQDDTERLVSVYRKYIKGSSLIIFIFCATLAAVARPLVLIVMGDKWLNAVVHLQIFSVTYMFSHISTINLNLLKVVGRSDLYLRLEIIKKVISIVMLLAAVPFGVLAICITMFVYNQISIIINTYYTGKLFNLGYWAQVKDFAKYLVFSLLSTLPAFLMSLYFTYNFLALLFGTVLSFLLYYFLLRKDSLMIECTQLISIQWKKLFVRKG